jgi:hypothetical protein
VEIVPDGSDSRNYAERSGRGIIYQSVKIDIYVWRAAGSEHQHDAASARIAAKINSAVAAFDVENINVNREVANHEWKGA